ncbi:kinase-like protein, partial [Laetiporus sulphureus 93-53]
MPSKESRVPDLSLKVIDDGRLQLLNFVGAGCHGTIYRARDRKAPSGQFTFYAVKVVPIADPFTRYGRLQAREVSCHKYVSGHPNIIKLHRIVRDDEFIYLVLDYCPSGDMHKLLIERMTIARNDVLIRNLFLQLIDAVDACHQNGIFHRDLKPANILVSADATHLYLSDFGLATKQLHCTSFGTGTGSYMSPDCINADGVHLAYNPRRADIWALGVILINMVTGRYPWARAVREDQFYGQYLEDTHVLRYMLPISQGMHDILARVFTPLPKDSIDLRTMRRLIVDLDTFYMSEEELADASVNAKRCWKSYYPL